MPKLIIFLVLVMTSFHIWVKDVEIFIMDKALRTVQYGLEHAAHDAALHIDILQLSEGKIQFVEPAAEAAIYESLQRNMPIDSSLKPKTKAFLQEPLNIEDIFYIDNDYVDINTGKQVEFPFQWTYTFNDGNTLTRSIFGPSVVLIAEAYVKGGGEYKPFVVIQEYKK